ncbi:MULTISPECIES: FAD-dependent monooxygenase [Actinomadura]|uniref:FAD-dependent monooxygenase n=1 Tax=Actinomadura yumaensis TaxID=111807 RepID=A0ABW2D1G9_9ACTN|nr:FAD-dependent monooxygenase [Actinomadura sp. J1-007]MWK35529.1 FAD-dependent oxidoreductase [Actinomadura sp. J1-007]
MSLEVLISGASVAGPALAYWLVRHGCAVTVVERAVVLREGGYAVDFRGDAHLGVLRRMGVLGEIEAARTRMGAMVTVDRDGRERWTMPEDLFAGDVEILRGDLVRILYEASRDGAEYVFGDSVTALEEDPDGVRVTFEHGPPRRYDLVIGADGYHSNVRSLAFGPEHRYATHLGLYNAVFTTDNHLKLDHSGLGYSERGRLVAIYSARGNTEAKAMFYFASPPLDDEGRRDPERQKKILAERFAGHGWETERLLAAMADAPDFYFDAVGQIHVDGWSRGRVALLGDAAACPSSLSGMGTGLAVVGAYVLAGEIAASPKDHRAAFARYEAVMRPYAERCQKQGKGAAKFIAPEGRIMTWLLAQQQRAFPYLPGKGLIAKAARRTAEAVDLPDYAL